MDGNKITDQELIELISQCMALVDISQWAPKDGKEVLKDEREG